MPRFPSIPPVALKLLPFLAWRHRVNRQTLRLDLLAGLVAAVMVLPQGVAFATLAGMPPEYGLYGAMLPALVGALWGSSWHLVSGPTNATSLMVFATVSAFAAPFTPTYVTLVLTLNLMVGLMKLGLGIARLGTLVNFISTAVVIGFTAGAGLLIIGAQLRNFFGIVVPQEPTFILGLRDFAMHIRETDPAVLGVGAFTLVAAIASKRWWPRVPYMMSGIVLGALFAWVLALLDVAHVATIGALPSAIPPLSTPDLSLQTWQSLAPIALALMVIGLSEAISSARAGFVVRARAVERARRRIARRERADDIREALADELLVAVAALPRLERHGPRAGGGFGQPDQHQRERDR